jgi:glutathione S-transferase
MGMSLLDLEIQHKAACLMQIRKVCPFSPQLGGDNPQGGFCCFAAAVSWLFRLGVIPDNVSWINRVSDQPPLTGQPAHGILPKAAFTPC